ncbi:MAG: hypothetical protein M1151_06945 [Candidatus Thermoplasmatota archaeon]|nr:hypothetical protein [Candidatus Thermoplasmatota archaeon]MCL5786383.1 hypothetical protein [Candidatus Thermoplasmatota archaeon]
MHRIESSNGFTSLCIFNDSGICHLNSAFPSPCVPCFNFATPVTPDGSRTNRMFTIVDFALPSDRVERIIPVGTGVQKTL